MAAEDAGKGMGCWPVLLALSLICTMTAVWISQRVALNNHQVLQRNLQIQQQQREWQQQLERSRRGW